MAYLDDMARFIPHDPSAVVAASFACPLCLCAPTEVRLAERERVARCHCSACEATWLVLMSAEQLLRVSLAPPYELALEPSACDWLFSR